MEAWRSLQLQLHRQQRYVKGTAAALLAVTLVAFVFSYIGRESSNIRSSGMIAFNGAETPNSTEGTPSVLARHVRTALIFASRDAHGFMMHMDRADDACDS